MEEKCNIFLLFVSLFFGELSISSLSRSPLNVALMQPLSICRLYTVTKPDYSKFGLFPPPPLLVSSTTGWKTCEVYPALPASSAGASCSQPCSFEPPVERCKLRCLGPASPLGIPGSWRGLRHLYGKKLLWDLDTQPTLTIPESLNKSCWFHLQNLSDPSSCVPFPLLLICFWPW